MVVTVDGFSFSLCSILSRSSLLNSKNRSHSFSKLIQVTPDTIFPSWVLKTHQSSLTDFKAAPHGSWAQVRRVELILRRASEVQPPPGVHTPGAARPGAPRGRAGPGHRAGARGGPSAWGEGSQRPALGR